MGKGFEANVTSKLMFFVLKKVLCDIWKAGNAVSGLPDPRTAYGRSSSTSRLWAFLYHQRPSSCSTNLQLVLIHVVSSSVSTQPAPLLVVAYSLLVNVFLPRTVPTLGSTPGQETIKNYACVYCRESSFLCHNFYWNFLTERMYTKTLIEHTIPRTFPRGLLKARV